MSNLRAVLFITTCLFLVACGSADEDSTEEGWVSADGFDDDGKSDGRRQTVPTQNPNAAMWKGFDPIFDRVTPNSCLSMDDARLGPSEPEFRIPTLQFIRSRQQLAEELGIDLSGGGNIGGVADAEGGFKLLNKFSRSTDSVVLLVRITADYLVLRRDRDGSDVGLSERGRELLEREDLNGFLSECGTHYVNAVRRGGEINVMLTFSAADKRRLTEVTATASGDATGAPVEVDAGVTQSLENASQNMDISVTTAATGFTMAVPEDQVQTLGTECTEMFRTIGQGGADGTDDQIDSLFADLLTNGEQAFPQLFSHIECLNDLMRVSLTRDARTCSEGRCLDANSAPKKVYLGEYRAAGASAYLSQLSTLERERRRIARAVDTLISMRVRTRAAYWNEIEPFLSAAEERKATFAAPDANAQTVRDLQDLADHWSGQFSPEPNRNGEVDRDLTRLLEDCRAEASNDLYHLCVPESYSAAEELPEYVTAVEQLERYQTERLLPLQVTIAPIELRFGENYCEKLGPGHRLPRKSELSDLELLVSSGPVPGNTTWFSDDENDCTVGAYFDPTAEPQIDCSWLGKRGTVCVSPGGIYPSLNAL